MGIIKKPKYCAMCGNLVMIWCNAKYCKLCKEKIHKDGNKKWHQKCREERNKIEKKCKYCGVNNDLNIYTHNNQVIIRNICNKCMSIKNTQKAKNFWTNPENNKKLINRLKEYWSKPENKEKRINAIKNYKYIPSQINIDYKCRYCGTNKNLMTQISWNHTVTCNICYNCRNNMSKNQQKMFFSNPENKKQIKIKQIEYWNKPENKIKQSNKAKEYWNSKESQENKLKQSINATKYFSNIENRKQMSNKIQKYFSNQENRNKVSKKHIQIMASPRGELIRQKIRLARAKQIFPFLDTKIEVKIQNFLTQLNIEFKRHKPILDIEHCYNCDIYIPSLNMVIEADGDYWHQYPNGNNIDHIRNDELKVKGYNVLRLWERDIKVMSLNDFKEKLLLFSVSTKSV